MAAGPWASTLELLVPHRRESTREWVLSSAPVLGVGLVCVV